MKLQFALILSLTMVSFSPSFASPLLADEEGILKSIDDTCGDSWCEGDYGYAFKQVILQPEQNSTEVQFVMSIEDSQAPASDSVGMVRDFDVSCTVQGFSDPSEVMHTRYTLDPDFYTQLDSCIRNLEQKLAVERR